MYLFIFVIAALIPGYTNKGVEVYNPSIHKSFVLLEEGSQTTYKIENKEVSEKEFNDFLKKLKEIPGTYFCHKTTDGGINGYEAKDKKGVIYIVKFALLGDESIHSINKQS